MPLIEEIQKSIYDGDEKQAIELVKKALQEDISPENILNGGVLKGLRDCGAEFEKGTKFIPEILMTAEAMKASMKILKPILASGGQSNIGKVILATVEGDVHDIGLELVATMLEGAGFNVIFMGADVPTANIIAAVKGEKPHVVGLSALLTTTMEVMPVVLKELKANGLRESVKVMVGGAPVTQEFCDKIGADGYADDAAAAVPLTQKLMVS